MVPKKSENTIIPQNFQRGEPKNGQHGIIKFKYPQCQLKGKGVDLDMCHHIEKNRVMI
jgi:hypothetical protein